MFSQNIGAMVSEIPEVAQYFARMTSSDANLREHLRTLIEGLVDDGLWSKLDKLSVAQTLESDSLLNLVSSSYPAVNSQGCAFTADQGFTVVQGSADYIESGFTEDGSTNYTDNDATQFVYTRNADNDGYLCGAIPASGPEVLLHPAASQTGTAIQQFTGPSVTYTAGFQAGSRPDASTQHVCSKRTTASSTSSAFSKGSFLEMLVGTANSESGPSTGAGLVADNQYAAHGFGAGMSTIELLQLEARLQTYFTSRGTAV